MPVISSPRQGVLCDLLKQEGCGLSYDTGDADGLAKLLTALDEDRKTLAQMSANARKVFTQQFDADKVCANMAAHLEHIVRTFRSAPEKIGSVALNCEH